MIDIRGHFKPNAESLLDVENASENIVPSNLYKNFKGFIPFKG